MACNKYDLLLAQINKLLSLHGEYAFLSCSNTFLKKEIYTLITVEPHYFLQYMRGIEIQFEQYLNDNLNILSKFSNKNNSDHYVYNFFKLIEDYWVI